MEYLIRRARQRPRLDGGWDDPTWAHADVVAVDQFHPRSSSHRPVTRARVLYDEDGLYVLFHVQDRHVRCVNTGYQAQVSRDTCVEFFVQPRGQGGYFNFEMNCGGSLLLYFIEDPTRTPDAIFRRYQQVPPEWGSQVRIVHSLPRRIEPEIAEPVDWTLSCTIPVKLLEAFAGPLAPLAGQRWRGNFFKCGDDTSHPHWASWSAIGETLRFHQPQYFGTLSFDK